jgi:hypothetical protein
MSPEIKTPADKELLRESGDPIDTLANKMRESIRSTKKTPAPGFRDEDTSNGLEIRLADVTQYVWKSLSLTQWKRDLTIRATAIVIGIKYFRQYHPKAYPLGSIRTLREELTSVYQSLPGLHASPQFQWWDQPLYDAIGASESQIENEAEGLETAVALRLRMNGYQKELQAMVEGISNHTLSQTDLALSRSIHQGLVLIREVRKSHIASHLY